MFSSLSSFQLSSSSTPPYLTDLSIELFPDDVDVPALVPPPVPAAVDVPVVPAEDVPHAVPPAAVYPVESPSTDLAPSTTSSVPLSSDLPVRHSTRVRETPSYLRDYHCFSTVLAQYKPHS